MPPTTYSAYPVKSDVESLLTGIGLVVPSGFDVAPYIQGAVDEWEETTHYQPFLSGVSQAFLFDPPGPNKVGERRGGGRTLILDRGFTAISEVRVGLTPTDAVGTVLTLATDYRLKPYNAAYDNKPFTEIEFTFFQYGMPESIRVTGTPGYCAVLKAEVWGAIRDMAAARYAYAILEGSSQNPVKWNRGETGESFDPDRLEHFGRVWHQTGRATMMRYVKWD